jgi:hypothetical protein
MVEESKSSNRNLVIILAVAALALALVVGIVIVAVALRGNDSGEGAETAASATLMPADTLAFASFNPHLSEAENFAVIEKAWADNPLVQMGLGEMLSSMETEGFDYKVDIESWLGSEISFGMLGDLAGLMTQGVEMSFSGIPGQAPQMGESPAIPQFTIAVATKDKGASDKFLDKLRAEAEQNDIAWQETEYKGIKIVYAEPDAEGEPDIAYATVDDFVVLAIGGLEPMQALIDAQDGTSQNLADNQDYKDVIAKLPVGQLGYGYIDLGAYIDAFLEAAGPELGSVNRLILPNPEQYAALRGAGYSVGFEPNGLRVDFAMVYDKDALPENLPGTQASAGKAAERMPANTLLFVSGSGLGGVFQGALDAVKAMPGQPEDLDEQLQMLTAMLGVSVEELVEMLSGEFAVAIAHDPAGIGGDASFPVGASVLIEAKDQGKFENLVNSVSALLTLGAEMELPKETISGVEVTMFSNPSTGDPIAGWGVGNGFFAIATSHELLEAAFGGGGDKLADTDTYHKATAPLPETRSGLLYMDLDGLLEFMVANMGPAERESFSEAQPVLAPIKAISAAMEPFDNSKDAVSGTFFMLVEGE